jgi:hypothetical protein
MAVDPITAGFAQQSIRESQARTTAALQKYEDESIRVCETTDKFYGSLALFSGGTIALSITYLGYLKGTAGKTIIYPRVLIAVWICLLVCAVTSIFCPLLNSYYAHFARLGIYINSLVEQKETAVQELDNLNLTNATTPEEKQESISKGLWTGFGWVARFAFPIGLGLLMYFAVKNM